MIAGTIISFIKKILKPSNNFTNNDNDDINTIGITIFYYVEGDVTKNIFHTLIDDIEGAKINQDIFIQEIIDSGIHKNITEKDIRIVELIYT